MTTCTFFIKPSQNPPNLQEIKDKLSKGTLQQKSKAMKQLVKCLVSDQNYPPIIMHIISTIIPIQHQSQQLRKIMLLYWQVIQKCKSPTDKNLKQQIFLACNSLRNDLLCHNQYVRGRTLRLISRIMHRGVIQPLASAITNNLQHKSSYVRRNAVVCLYNVFITFGSDVIGDIDDDVQELLLKQTDLSTKRNAFLLLNKSNPQKALKYLQQQINFQAVQQIGDILQLAILKILKQKCKQDSSQKAKLLKIVNDFSLKATQSVKLQCAITSTSISNSPGTIKSSLYSYVNILTKTNQLNVKKIILDKLELICKNSNYMEQDLIEDLIKGLQTPSIDIKMKILHIVLTGITLKTSTLVLRQLQNELNTVKDDKQYLIQVIKILQVITFRFSSQHQQILKFIIQKIFPLQQILRQGIESTQNILKKILVQAQKKQLFNTKLIILDSFDKIYCKDLIKVVLNILGNFFNKEQEIQKVINKLKITIGSLPICVNVKSQTEISIQKQQKQIEQKKVFKTIILQDGSYSTELVHQKNLIQERPQNKQQNYSFRNSIAQDSIIGGIFARNISKLLYKIRKTVSFNKHACSILMILCSIIRYYEQNIFSVDQAIVEEISLLIRKIVNPTQFIKVNDELFNSQVQAPKQPRYQSNDQSEMIQKNPEDMINFRLLKKGGDQGQHFDFDDDQVNDITNQQVDKKDYITKLKSLVQLTGAFDPLYSQAFVTVNKYDIFFQILLINTTKSNLLNIQIQFSSPAAFMILQKAQCINLRSKQSVMLRTQLRFSGNQFGVIYGYVNFDSHAGLEQPYLITQQINIDYMQFIQPARISQEQFKSIWQRITNQQVIEQRIIPNKNKLSFKRIIEVYEQTLHAKCIQALDGDDNEEQYFINCHLYGKSKLGEDFLINVALFSGQQISSTVTIRSKDQAVQQIVHKQLLKCNFEHIDEQEQEEEQHQN